MIEAASPLDHWVFHITLQDETIKCTKDHPFWVGGRGWIKAGNLRAGDNLQDARGQAISILEVMTERLRSPVRVYNITVAEQHTYFIGKSQALVHNKNI